MKYFPILIIFIVLSSCGASIAIDYDRGIDFSDFTSYQFYSDIASGVNELETKRIMKAIETSLENREFTRTDYCRFYINFYVSEYVTESRNTLGIGVGGGGGNVDVGVSGGMPIGGRLINQRLTIDVIDTSRGQELVWQAVIDGEIKEKSTPEQKEAYYYSVIEKALQKFPPK